MSTSIPRSSPVGFGRIAALVVSAVALAVAAGGIWAGTAGGVAVRFVDGGTALDGDWEDFFAGPLAMMGILAITGAIFAMIAARLLPNGVLRAVLVTVLSVLGAAVALWVGTLIAHQRFPIPADHAVGTQYVLPQSLRLGDAVIGTRAPASSATHQLWPLPFLAEWATAYFWPLVSAIIMFGLAFRPLERAEDVKAAQQRHFEQAPFLPHNQHPHTSHAPASPAPQPRG